jgi:DNA-binding transcriptional MocR family regulator
MILLNLNHTSKDPLFRQIQFQIQDLIERNILQPGYRLPPTRILSEYLGVHRSTVYKAYEELWALGYVESRPGSYSTVRNKLGLATHDYQKSHTAFSWQEASSPAADKIYRLYRNMEPRWEKPIPDKVINMAALDLDKRLFPVDEFRKAMNRAFIDHGPELLKYGACRGYRPLREYIAQRLQIHGISISWEEILITNGAQDGFDLVLKLLATPGCRVLVESPTYSYVIPMLHYYRADIVGIPMEKTGMNLRRLEAELKKGGRAILYTIPNFHNPTGITTTQTHREELLAICEKYRIPLVEDAFEEEMKYFGKVPLPIKSMDRDQIVIYLGTFSKVLFPGIRIGWVAASRECIERLAALKRYSDLSTSTPIQAALVEFCQRGSYDWHVNRLHRFYRKRMQKALDSLKRYASHPRVTWTEPSGGYLIWLRMENVDIKDDELDVTFMSNGVRVIPGSAFFPQRASQKFVRLSISTLDEDEIEEGIRRLGKTIQQIYG